MNNTLFHSRRLSCDFRAFARRWLLLAASLWMLPVSLLNAQDVLWRTTLNNDAVNRDTARHMGPLTNGDLVVGGQSGPSSVRNFIVYRLNGSTGAVMWTRTLDSGFNSDDVNDLIADPATGDTYICGRAGSAASALNWYVMKINGSNGADAWAAPYVFDLASQNDEARALFFSPNDGHVVVVGTTTDSGGTPRGRLVKFNSATGAQIWATATSQQLWTGVADSSGNVFCGGETFAASNQATITKFNSSGTQQWSQTYAPNGGSFNRWNYIALDGASGDVVTGGLNLGSQGDNDIGVARYRSSDGARLWNRHINGTFGAANDQCSSVMVDSGGDVYITGFYRATSSDADWYAARLDIATGATVWEKTYNGNSTGNEQLENLRVVGSTVYLAGYHTSSAPPAATAGRILRVMKLNKSDGSTILATDFLDRAGPQVIGSKALIVTANGNMIVSGDSAVTTNAAEIARLGVAGASSNANLSALTTTAGALSPAFVATTPSYNTPNVPNATASVTVTATVSDSNATLQARVNGGAYSTITSGAASGALALAVGPNTINVLVTAQDGTTTKTYTITVTRDTATPSPSGQVHGGTAGSYDWPFSSMAKDSAGNIYGFWRRDSGTTAVYSLIKWNSGTSTFDTLSTFTSANVGATANMTRASDDVSLAVDGAGGFHVAFRGDYGANTITSTRGVWYGYSANGTTWTFTQVETYSDPNGWKNTDDPTIRVDSNNRPHIVFDYDDVNGGRSFSVRYRWFDGTTWQGSGAAGNVHVQAGNASNEVNYPNFALDSNNKAHFVFQAETNGSGLDGGLFYVNNVSGSFSAAVALAAGATNDSTGYNSDILIDAAGKIHITHQRENNAVYYCTNASGSFVNTQINGNLVGYPG